MPENPQVGRRPAEQDLDGVHGRTPAVIQKPRKESIMGLRINQNIDAVNSYRNLSVTQGQMSKSLEKLSSGFRINRAADDAAGLAISEGLRSQVGGLKVGARNAQDGVSLVQTAEGALTEVHSMLQRMNDLSVQYNQRHAEHRLAGRARGRVRPAQDRDHPDQGQHQVQRRRRCFAGADATTFQVGYDERRHHRRRRDRAAELRRTASPTWTSRPSTSPTATRSRPRSPRSRPSAPSSVPRRTASSTPSTT